MPVRSTKPLVQGSLLISLFFAPLVCPAGELIPPTRTLQAPHELPAQLTVFSEPPRLRVFLDGSEIGRTPVRRQQVKAGTYALRVQHSETEMKVGRGEEVRISGFKGAFIHIPKSEKAAEELPGLEQEETQVTKTPEPAPKQPSRDLTPWERFVHGTSPHF